MSCSELTKLVKAYTNGEIPLEIYREQRRKIVDEVVNGPKLKKKNDPLDAFIASAPQKSPALGIKSPSVYLTITGAALVIVVALYLILVNKHTISTGDQTTNKETQSTQESKPHAQRLVEKFLLTDQWNEESINQFILDWQILSPAERQQAQNTVWFSRFKSIIQNQLEKQKKLTAKTDTLTEDLLTSLLVTVDPGHFIRQPFFTEESHTPTTKPESEKIPSAPPVVVAGAEQPPPVSMSDSSAKTSGEKEPSALSKEPSASSKEPSAFNKQSSPVKKEPSTIARKPETGKTSRKEKAIDTAKLNNLLNEFVQSFQSGNLSSLMRLFSSKATTNYHSSAAEIKNSYSELFHTTAARALRFSDFSWKPLGNKIEGSGKYQANLNPKGTNVNQVFTADVTIMVDNSGKSPLISGLYLTNQQFSTTLRQSAKTQAPAKTVEPPEKEELRKLLTEFVTAYNRGDIDALMALFSQEARTNDRSNFNDIRDDYLQLFNTTKSREIILTNIVWDVDGSRAVANGFFEARILPTSGAKLTIYRGKIRIAVTKFQGGILITQLLHNTF